MIDQHDTDDIDLEDIFEVPRGDDDGDSFPQLPSVSRPEGRTDLANSRRFRTLFRNRCRYCHQWKSWLVHDGKRWRRDDAGTVFAWAKQVADHVWREARQKDDRDALVFASRTASSGGINGMLKLAESDLPICVGEMDRDGMLLNVGNGTLDLRKGALRPHDARDFITQLCPHAYDPAATCPTWELCLRGVFDGDAALVEYLRRRIGYALTGMVGEQDLLILHGSGANGKSTIVDSILHVLGEDYGGTAPPSLLIATRQDRHPTEIAALFGKRLVVAHESDEGRRLNEGLVKQLTGGDRLTGRRMREDFWEFPPTHKMMLLTNHRPRVTGDDNGIWRRLKLLPFEVTFGEDRRDKAMPDKLKAEAAGILRWAVSGCLAWQQHGMAEPAAVSTATASYRSDEDSLSGFIADRCVVSPNAQVKAGHLYDAYRTWAESRGERTLSQRNFGARLKLRFDTRHSNGIVYVGVGLASDEHVEF